MKAKDPIKLDDRIYLIDGLDLEMENRTGTYVIDEEELALIETGPSPSIKYVKQGLMSLGFTLDQVQYIIVTHIHLDHAGGAGMLMKECPNAKIVVHPRGERHLIDPRKLAAGARAVYGDSFQELFEPIIPVPEDRILIKTEGDTLQIGPDCTLEFYDTPGHARHHFSIYDPVSNGMFTGDTAGIRYELLYQEGIEFYLPSTSPNHFDPNAMKHSIQRYQEKNLSRIYFGHFGMTDNVDEVLRQVLHWIDVFVEEGEQVIAERKGYDVLSDRLLNKVRIQLRDQGISDDHEVYIILNLDMQVSSLGLIDYFQKIKQ